MAAQRSRVPLPNWNHQKDLVSSAGDGSPKYLLEMARTFSLERESEPVLCARFLLGIDLLVSADTWSPCPVTAQAIEGRFEEVLDVVHGRRDPLRIGGREWSAGVLSFGLVRWWPSWIRNRIAHSLGPFHVVIDCQTPSVQMDNGAWMADSDARRSAGDGAAW